MGKGRGREAIEEPMGQGSVRDDGGLMGVVAGEVGRNG